MLLDAAVELHEECAANVAARIAPQADTNETSKRCES